MKRFVHVVQPGAFVELDEFKITTEKVENSKPCEGCVFKPGTIGCNTHQCGLDVHWITQEDYIAKYITPRFTK